MVSSVRDLFTEIPNQFDPTAWGQDNAVLQFNITGDAGGSWTAAIDAGKLTVTEGQAENASMTMTCASQDMLAIVNGELSAVRKRARCINHGARIGRSPLPDRIKVF